MSGSGVDEEEESMGDEDDSQLPSAAISATQSSQSSVTTANSNTTTDVRSNDVNPASTTNRRNYVRQFPADYTGILEVWVRSADNTKLPNVTLQRALNTRFKSIGSIKPDREKLCVVFGDRAEANSFVRDTIYQGIVVSIPDRRRVDVYGAVRADDLDGMVDLKFLIDKGVGLFGDVGLPPCRILFAEQLYTRPTGDSAIREATNTVKITFEGTLLPKYVGIDNLRIPVRLFWKPPMFCVKCQTHGHTDKTCRRPVSCARCGYAHLTAACSNAAVNKTLCPHCGKKHADTRLACPYFQQVTKHFQAKQIASSKQRYQQAVASIRQRNAGAQRPRQQAPVVDDANFPQLRNAYASLEAGHDDTPVDMSSGLNPHALLPPPKNPYTPRARARTPNKRNRDGSTVSHQSARQQPTNQHSARQPAEPQQPARQKSAPNAATNRQPANQQQQTLGAPTTIRRPALRRDRSTAGTQSSALKCIILALASSSGLSTAWMAILEAIIDPLLNALLPNSEEIVAAVTPLLQHIQ